MPTRVVETLETRFTANHRDLDRGFQHAERRSAQATQNINRNLSSIGQGFSASRGNFLPGLGNISEIIQALPTIGRLAGALVRPLTDATQEGVRFNMMIETAEAGFVGVARSVEGARKHVEAIRKFGEDSPLFETEGLIRTSQLLNVFGFQLSEHIPKIKVWGDAIAAQGQMSEETLLGVARAFGQMRAIGRVNAEEMNQLAERGIPAWELLAQAIGKTVAETRKLGEQGKLSGPAAVEAITAMIAQDPRFRGTAERQAGTLAGRLARVQEIQSRSQGLATETLTRDISGALEGALTQEDLAIRMAQGFDKAIAPVSGLIKATVVGTVTGGITTGFAEGINASSDIVFGAVKDLGLNTILTFARTLGIQSPSKEFMYLGEMAGQGFAQGLRQSIRDGRLSEEVEKLIAEAAERFGLDPNLIRAVIRKESGGRKRAVSSAGAAGLMQLMPGTGERYGVRPDQRFNPRLNVMAGSQYLADLLRMFGGREDLALAGYNSGENRKEYRSALKQDRPINWSVMPEGVQSQTRAYVAVIMQELARVRSGFSGMQLPMPVRIVGGDGAAAEPYGRTDFTKKPVYENGQLVGYDAYDPTALGQSFGAKGFADPGVSALTAPDIPARLTDFTREATEAQFNLLKTLGEIGPTADEAFQQAGDAAGQWYDRVVTTTNQARSVFGITAQDMKGSFEDAWVGAFTNVEAGFKGMASQFILGWAQTLNAMAQQWAASQLSNIFGSLLSGILGGIGGGATPGAANAAFGSVPFLGFASGTLSAPAGLAVVGEGGPELVNLRGGERIYNNTETRQMVNAPTRTISLTVNFVGQNSTPYARQQQAQVARNLLDMLNHEMERGG